MSERQVSPTVQRTSPKRPYGHWTKADEEILRELYSQGKPTAVIAHEMGRTVSAVEMQASRMGLSRSACEPRGNLKAKRLSEHDIATRIASLLGESPRIEVEERPFTDEELLQFTDKTSGLVAFLRVLLGVELQDYQQDIAVKLAGPRNLVVVSGRQVGKDFVIACFALWQSIVKPNSKIVVVSAAQRQSDLLSDRILGFVAMNDQLYASVLKASREELRFKNGSAMHFLPATGLIRGFTEVTRVFVNEARDVPDTVYDAVSPMLSRRNGHLAVFSTPLGRVGHLWEIWNSPLYEHVHIRSDQNHYLAPDFLKKERERMSDASFRCEYDGEFVSSQENYFAPESIKAALQDYDLGLVRDPNLRYAVGVDWGRKQDASVMLVLSSTTTGELKVAFIKSFENVSFQDQLPYVAYLRDTFQPIAIIPERNGLGIGPTDALERMGIKISPFDTTNESKSKLFDDLRSKFDRHELTVPIEPYRLQHELFMLQYVALPSGAVRISASSGEHDDFCMALALANHGFTKPKYDPDRFISCMGHIRGTTKW